eukprot:GEMP01000518.1.p1 GENE.GEMP01000518.1~~GEMP01000518.1.p1  ORF type:complete len:1399 (+),score=206.43 GEMP01000518.1:588-4784(+)
MSTVETYRDQTNKPEAYFERKGHHFSFPGEVSVEDAFAHTTHGQLLKKFPMDKNRKFQWKSVSERIFFIDSEEGALKWKSRDKWKFIFLEEIDRIFVLHDQRAETVENMEAPGQCGNCTNWRQVKSERNYKMFAIVTFHGILWLWTPTRLDLKLWVTAIEASKWIVMKRQLDGTGIQDTFLRYVERQFRISDEDGDGFLNFTEIILLLRRLNIKITNNEAKAVFEKLTSANQLISVLSKHNLDNPSDQSWARIFTSSLPFSDKPRRGSPFKHRRSVGWKSSRSPKHEESFLHSFDADKSGTIDVSEFLEMLRQFNIVDTLRPYFLEYCSEPRKIIDSLTWDGDEDEPLSPTSMRTQRALSPTDSSHRSEGFTDTINQEGIASALQGSQQHPFGRFSTVMSLGYTRKQSRTSINTKASAMKPQKTGPLQSIAPFLSRILPFASTTEKQAEHDQDHAVHPWDTLHIQATLQNPSAEARQKLPPKRIMEKERGFIEEHKFCRFLQKVQVEKGYIQKAHGVFKNEVPPSILRNKYMTEFGFSRYVCSEQNSIYNPLKSRLDKMSMGFPLSQYWIASSHNTYLEAGQLVGASSVEQYFDVLNRGCRCVELDCWDGDKGDPIITHGYTITKKIRLRDVCRTLKKHAFVKSQFPLILSIEQHCSAEQKAKCREIFEEELGTSLLRRPPGGLAADQGLITPHEARSRIIIKAKTWIDPPDKSLALSTTTARAAASTARYSLDGEATDFVALWIEEMDKYNQCIYLESKKWAPDKVEDPGKSKGSRKTNGKKSKEREDKVKNGGHRVSSDTVMSDPDMTEVWDPDAPDGMRKTERIGDADLEEIEAGLKHRDPLSIVSFNETKIYKHIAKHREDVYYFHSKFLSRVYPTGTRIKSSNYDPMIPWSIGAQMVALNYQTYDKETLKNEGRFRYPNGGCGYVLKPKVLRELSSSRFVSSVPLDLEITIMSGHGLPKPRRSQKGQIVNPCVTISVDCPGQPDQEFKTEVVTDNGFNPNWNETFKFRRIDSPCLSLVTFEVFDQEKLSDNEFLGAAAFPVDGIRQGLRWVPLFDYQFTTVHHCGLLVAVKMHEATDDVKMQSFSVDSSEHKDVFEGMFVWIKLWCQSRPVYQKDSVTEQPLFIYFNGEKGKNAGWVAGPEPFQKQTYYAISRDTAAWLPSEITAPWELIRDPNDKQLMPPGRAKFSMTLSGFEIGTPRDGSPRILSRMEVLKNLLQTSETSPSSPATSRDDELDRRKSAVIGRPSGVLPANHVRAAPQRNVFPNETGDERRGSVSPVIGRQIPKMSQRAATVPANKVLSPAKSTGWFGAGEEGILGMIAGYFNPPEASAATEDSNVAERQATAPSAARTSHDLTSDLKMELLEPPLVRERRSEARRGVHGIASRMEKSQELS